MTISSKLSFSAFILILAALTFYGYPVIKDRYTTISEEKTQTKSATTSDESSLPSESPETIFDQQPGDIEEGEEAAEADTFVQVLPADCKNECKNFQIEEDIAYCKQICGLTAPKKQAAGCDALDDLEKDYCLKDQAITKTDPKICEKIEDAGIKKSCKNRLIEDIVDAQNLQQ
ncbi:MAG: hypothetical protein ACD_14C00019G0001 [uncultured bacterium]|nr:MAG: hypothetical protein ACD_14C00019G0001 [uncultured bacterium]